MEISEIDSGSLFASGIADDENIPKAKRRDNVFILLLGSSFLSLMFALLLGSYLVIRSFISIPTIQLADLTVSLENLIGQQATFVIILTFLFLAFSLFLIARLKVTRNPSMAPAAGCPSCQHQELVRVRRTYRDRIIALIGIPVKRFHCRDCRWNGRRILKGSHHILRSQSSTKRLDASIKSIRNPNLSTHFREDDTEKNTEMKVDAEVSHDNLLYQNQFYQDLMALNSSSLSKPLPDNLQEYEVKPESKNQDLSNPISVNSSIKAVINTPLRLNLREEPRSDADVLVTLNPGAEVNLLGELTYVNDVPWQKIEIDGECGWVLNTFLKPV